METLLQDLRYAARTLLRAPGFTLTAVLTLALGIGATTAMFSVVDGVLLRPLPFAEPDRLVSIPGGMTSRGELQVLRGAAQSFAGIAAYNPFNEISLTGEGEPVRLESASVSTNLFPLLGVQPALGRMFLPTEAESGGNPVVVLNHALWRQRFGADPGILGRQIVLDGVSRTVVGVMPAEFAFPDRGTELWVPISMEAANPGDLWGSGGYLRVARLAPDATLEAAQAEVRALAPRIREQVPWQMPAAYWTESAPIQLREQIVGDVRQTLWVLLGAVGAVLLIACVNVANLLLVRGAARRREMALRNALGAGRGRIARQIFTESMLLALLGGIVGTVLGVWGVALLSSVLPADTPRLDEIGVDARVLAFAFGVSVLTGSIFGVLPALRAAGAQPQAALAEGARGAVGRRRQRLSSALVAAEIALAVVLVTGAGLLVQSFWRLVQVDPGFRTENLVSATVAPPEFRFGTDVARRELVRELVQRLEALPGTRAAAVSSAVPFSANAGFGTVFAIQGRPDPAQTGEWPSANLRAVVTEEFFRTLGVPLLRGRGFLPTDREGAVRVAVVNQALAREYWPDGDPIGERFRFPSNEEWLTVVGIVGNAKNEQLAAEDLGALYLPLAQTGLSGSPLSVLIRTEGHPPAVAASLQSTVAALDPDTPVSDIRTMAQLVSTSAAQPRLVALLLGLFAAVALLLGAVGIYGVLAYAVGQRTREIGIRLAVGAHTRDVLRLVLRQGMLLAAVGVGIGLIVSLISTRLLTGLLYNVSPLDPWTFTGVPLLLSVVALLAAYLPARRATRVDPMVALRAE